MTKLEQAKARYDAAVAAAAAYRNESGTTVLDPLPADLEADLNAAAAAYHALSNAQLRERAAVALGQGYGSAEEWD